MQRPQTAIKDVTIIKRISGKIQIIVIITNNRIPAKIQANIFFIIVLSS